MEDQFKIYVDRLKGGHDKTIEEKLAPDFLDVHEKDLTFKKNIELDGQAYLADQELILHWNIRAEAILQCKICNEPVPIDIRIENFYYAKPLSDIKSAVFDFKELLRETILLEVPIFAECNGGDCPKRQEIIKYLREKPASQSEEDENEGHRPFADLDLK